MKATTMRTSRKARKPLSAKELVERIKDPNIRKRFEKSLSRLNGGMQTQVDAMESASVLRAEDFARRVGKK